VFELLAHLYASGSTSGLLSLDFAVDWQVAKLNQLKVLQQSRSPGPSCAKEHSVRNITFWPESYCDFRPNSVTSVTCFCGGEFGLTYLF
jgi:hypothetical protein